jgi:hypothetical protein
VKNNLLGIIQCIFNEIGEELGKKYLQKDDDILRGVKKIKGTKYADDQIIKIIQHIRENFNLNMSSDCYV